MLLLFDVRRSSNSGVFSMNDDTARALRSIPSVTALLTDPRVAPAVATMSPEIRLGIVRNAQDGARLRILAGQYDAASRIVDHVLGEIDLLTRRSPVRVINGTGVIIQTNLGRAPVSRDAGDAMRDAAEGYVGLETDLRTGERGGRGSGIEAQMFALTGAERTLVVNNNAGAVFLMLAALCHGRDVLVSRGEAIEIGGGFRIPDVMRQSGVNLVEVGTTNRTYVSDYAASMSPNTAAFLKVHSSNFAMVGFTASPDLADLSAMARDYDVLSLEDAGSGCLVDTAPFGLAHEPTLKESIDCGVDVVCASGDKLLGGPQAGLILGRKDVIDVISRHPMARALRADKTCLAGVSATLAHYVRGDAIEKVPVWWSISRTATWLRERAGSWANQLGTAVDLMATDAVVGGGSLPGASLPSWGISLRSSLPADVLARHLRTGATSVVPRIIDDRVVIDARTVLPSEDAQLLAALRNVLS
jgi:L-seryl-tRNA(Ser) seleniumtransferase